MNDSCISQCTLAQHSLLALMSYVFNLRSTTFDSLFVSCVEGFNGGLQQFFVIEIWDRESRQVLRNLTNPRPVFHVRTLEPGSTYVIRIYAANNKGRSETQGEL